jgi:hypothetical protein
MNAWLNPEEAPAETVSNAVVDDDDTQPVAAAAVQAAPKATSKSPTATAAKTNTDDLTKAFDNLFNG